MSLSPITRAAALTPDGVARKIRGLSDRTIAWIFVAPTIFLLLAVNIFPLIWTIRLSFTNFRVNRPNNAVEWVGLENYQRILTDPTVWQTMQATAHFLIWTITLQVLIGFALAFLINKKFRGNDMWTTIIVFPMMLSPAVVGNFWTFLYQPQIGLFNYVVQFLTGADPASFSMIGDVNLAPWAIIIADTWMWTPFVMLICLAGLRSIPDSIYEAAECDRASAWRQFTGGGPGNTTTLTSIDLKREAFEKWRTGYSSAYAVILFVTVFGLASIYVKALNKVKER